MNGQSYQAFLRPLSSEVHPEKWLPPHPLSDYQEIVIGRDPSCEIALDPTQDLIVSRRHAVIRPIFLGTNRVRRWELCDLNSINGTYINGEYLRGCHQLRPGDRIELGQDGPQFIFEYQYSTPLISPRHPSQFTTNVLGQSIPAVTFTQLFPLASTGRHLTQKAFFIPVILTIIFVVLMFATVGEETLFNLLVSIYLTGATSYFIYQLCGKPKPWWVLLGCAGCTSLILISPLLPLFIIIFRDILPGSLPNEGEMVSFTGLLIHMFFGAGLMEELIKAIPILGAYLLGNLLRSPWRERVGVWEPLDGILLGTASAVGFTLLETLGQYVPDMMDSEMKLQLLIPRLLGSVAGHIAYSGYFGYFIGLSVLKPNQALQILTTGYLCAATLHALWNVTGFFNGVFLAVVGILSYAFLAAAILKARVLSPTRSQNFATRFFGD